MCFTKRKMKQKEKYKEKYKRKQTEKLKKNRTIIIQSKEVQPKRIIKKIVP